MRILKRIKAYFVWRKLRKIVRNIAARSKCQIINAGWPSSNSSWGQTAQPWSPNVYRSIPDMEVIHTARNEFDQPGNVRENLQNFIDAMKAAGATIEPSDSADYYLPHTGYPHPQADDVQIGESYIWSDDGHFESKVMRRPDGSIYRTKMERSKDEN